MDTEGRYLFLNCIANQLRYPNSHTHYYSCLLLYLFGEANTEAIQEQITRCSSIIIIQIVITKIITTTTTPTNKDNVINNNSNYKLDNDKIKTKTKMTTCNNNNNL